MTLGARQAVRQLNEAVAALPEGACDDLLVLPIYSALPLELQACPWFLLPVLTNGDVDTVASVQHALEQPCLAVVRRKSCSAN